MLCQAHAVAAHDCAWLYSQEVFSGQPLTAVEQLRRTDVIPPAMLADYQKLLSSNTGRRLNPAKVGQKSNAEEA